MSIFVKLDKINMQVKAIKKYNNNYLDVCLRMSHYAFLVASQKEIVLGYVSMYAETRVNGVPECWQAIQRVV